MQSYSQPAPGKKEETFDSFGLSAEMALISLSAATPPQGYNAGVSTTGTAETGRSMQLPLLL